MALRLRRFKEFSRVLPLFYSGHSYQLSRTYVNLLASHLNSSPQVWANISRSLLERAFHAQRFSTVAEPSHESVPEIDLLSFIESSLDELEGPYHCWLNNTKDMKELFGREGVFLVLDGAFLDESLKSGRDPVIMFEIVKSLQQRYPSLHVMGFQSVSSIHSDAVHTHLLRRLIMEYVTFPILLSNKNFDKRTDRPSYLLFKGFKNPLLYYEWDVDLGTIDKDIRNLNVQHNDNPKLASNLKSTWVKQTEVIREPLFGSSLQNMLLYFPGCISVDESGNRLFLSDTNHHRIIIFDGDGKILDCIGSSPGFEDGEFESAKVVRPAGSFYHAVEDCLYFVDSENHAIRRADMKRRVLETIYPIGNASKKSDSLWTWILDKILMKTDDSIKSDEFNSESFLFPWHLMKSSDNNIFVVNRSFETLWIMDLISGVIKEVVKGFPNILEFCGQMMQEKTSLLKQIPCDWLQQQSNTIKSFEGIQYGGLLSSFAAFQDYVIICDTVGQMVLKLNRESGSISSFHFSNFGILGLPYWVPSSLERVYAAGSVLTGVHADHVQCFSLLPGRIDIQLKVDIPEDTELVEPLQEGCVWCQARGAATELLGTESKAASSEKVGASQQWYDDLDNLAFSAPEVELISEEETTASDGNLEEGGVCLNCAVNTSPGTSEVIVYVALYLKLKREKTSIEGSKEKNAARVADILNPKRKAKVRTDPFLQLLLNSNRYLGEFVFMKPLHVRLKIDCRDHPKAADNSKEIILTDSSIEVNVSLD